MKTIALSLSLGLALLLCGCGSKEAKAPAAVTGAGAPSMGPGGGGGPAENASAPATASAAGDIAFRIVPTQPSRISPPELSVSGAGPGRAVVFREVVWIVNGWESAGGEKLDPSRFQKGDRIQARGKARVAGQETNFETPFVLAVNSPPLLGEVRLEPRAPTTEGTVRAIVAASDPDGEPVTITYKWLVDDKEVPGQGDTLSLKGVRKGSWVHARISTSDGAGEGPWKFSPRHQVMNSLPVVKSGSSPDNLTGRKFSYRIIAEDPDGDPLTFTLVKAPPGVVLNGSTLEWDVPDEYIGKPVEVVVNISDGNGGQTVQTYTMTFRRS